MSSHSVLYLDTTPPQGASFILDSFNPDDLTITAVINTSDVDTTNYQVLIWGSVDQTADPNIKSTRNTSSWINFDSFPVNKPIHLSSGDGNKVIRVVIRDDVKNETTVLTRTFLIGEAQNIEIGGGGQKFTHIGGPITDGPVVEFEFPANAEIGIPSRTEFSMPGLVKAAKPLQVQLSAAVTAIRPVEMVFEGSRTKAERWNRLIQDDEELVEMLI